MIRLFKVVEHREDSCGMALRDFGIRPINRGQDLGETKHRRHTPYLSHSRSVAVLKI